MLTGQWHTELTQPLPDKQKNHSIFTLRGIQQQAEVNYLTSNSNTTGL